MLLAGPVSQTSKQYTDFVKVFNVVKIFNVSLALSAVYFARFSVC